MVQLVSSEGEKILVRVPKINEVPEIAAVYGAVAVSPENAAEKLTEGPKSFGTEGGMFHALTEAEVAVEIVKPEEHLLVAECNGAVSGLVWFTLREKNAFPAIKPVTGMEEKIKVYQKACAADNIGYFKDAIAVAPKFRGICCYAMVYDMVKQYAHNGVDNICWEVYHLDRWYDGTAYHELDMMNRASDKFSRSCGADYIGDAPQKVMSVGINKVWITPHVYLLETATAVQNTQEIFKHKNWRIEEQWKME